MGDGLTKSDTVWVAAAWVRPQDLRDLGIPLNGAVSAAGRRALEAIEKYGAKRDVLRDRGGMTAEECAEVLGLVGDAPAYADLMSEVPAATPQGDGLLPELRPASILLDTQFPPLRFAIEPYFPRSELTELVGAHGIFKSTAALG
ncbi:MAG: hypothetical protein WB493_09610, partial [Anaeromyxobacteraceae bacterium]